MTDLKKSSLNSGGWYKYLCFIVLLFCVCTLTPDNCSDGNRVNYNTEFCYDGKAYPKCAGNKYDPPTQECVSDNVEEKCINGKYAKSDEPCEPKVSTFTVKFDTDGGTPETISSVTVDSGKTMGSKFPEDPKKTNLIFDGWFHNDKKYDSSTVITQNVTIKANFRLKQFTVRFDTDGGTPETISSVSVDTGKTIGEKLPSNPAKMGYNFDGWFHNDKQYDSSTVIIEDVTLKAKYQIKRFTVQFDTDGGSPSSIEPITVDTGKTIGERFPSSPTKTGFSFNGWYYADGASYYSSSTPITRNVTLRAQWETGTEVTTKYTLTTSSDPADGGSVNPTSGQEYTSGAEVTVTATPNMGYNFVGWSGASDSKENEIKIKMDSNRSLTAKFELKKYTVEFDTDGGTPETIESVTVDTGKTIGTEKFPSNPTKTGHNFDGWFDGNEKYNELTVITKNVKLKAKWALEITNAIIPDITEHPTSGTVTEGTSYRIFVKVNVTDGGTLSYQWYSNASAENSGGSIINGATDSVYTVPASVVGTIYYYVIITNTNNSVSGNKIATVRSDAAAVKVDPLVHAKKPVISTQPTGGSVIIGPAKHNISVTVADVSDGGTLSYQWYRSNTNANNSVGTVISGATGLSYDVPKDTTGIYYYYVIVTNKNDDVNGDKSVETRSNTVTVTVRVPEGRHFNPDPEIKYSYIIDGRGDQNQMYLTIKIGNQIWMAENLNYEVNGSKCYGYSYEADYYCEKYGRLYEWDDAIDACAGLGNGWHLPDTADWNRLVSIVSEKETAVTKLKSTSGWDICRDETGNIFSCNGNGTDDYGFSALPGGYQDCSRGNFVNGGSSSRWWSATEDDWNSYSYAYYWYMDLNGVGMNEGGRMYDAGKRCGDYVRCVQNVQD